jgi:hypothetical protein
MKKLFFFILIIIFPFLAFSQDEFIPKRILSGSFIFSGNGSGTKGLNGSNLGTTPLRESSNFSINTSFRFLKQRSAKWAFGPGFSYHFGKTIYERNSSTDYLKNYSSNIFTCFYQFRYTLLIRNKLSLYLAPEPFYGIRFNESKYSLSEDSKNYAHSFGANLVGGLTYLLVDKFQLNLQYDFLSFSKGISVDKANELITNSTSIGTRLSIATFSIGGELLF